MYTYKTDENGFFVKCKARLVVRGDLQHSSDFNEVYAATLAARIFRLTMALMAYFNMEVRQFNAVSAFTNANMDETVYIPIPEGIVRTTEGSYEPQTHCFQLRKALYGLKRSPLLWYRHIQDTLTTMGFEGTRDAPCLFIRDGIIVCFYVDNIYALYFKDKQAEYDQFR